MFRKRPGRPSLIPCGSTSSGQTTLEARESRCSTAPSARPGSARPARCFAPAGIPARGLSLVARAHALESAVAPSSAPCAYGTSRPAACPRFDARAHWPSMRRYRCFGVGALLMDGGRHPGESAWAMMRSCSSVTRPIISRFGFERRHTRGLHVCRDLSRTRASSGWN